MTVVARVNCTVKLLFVVPLKSLFGEGAVVLVGFAILIISLLAVTLAPCVRLVLFTSLLANVYSIVPRVFVPVTTRFSAPRAGKGGMNVVMSKLLANVLTSHMMDKVVNRCLK